MPELVNSSVGSLAGTSDDSGRCVCPFDDEVIEELAADVGDFHAQSVERRRRRDRPVDSTRCIASRSSAVTRSAFTRWLTMGSCLDLLRRVVLAARASRAQDLEGDGDAIAAGDEEAYLARLVRARVERALVRSALPQRGRRQPARRVRPGRSMRRFAVSAAMPLCCRFRAMAQLALAGRRRCATSACA